MGRSALIMVLGLSVSFGAIKFNLRTQALTDVETCVGEYERVMTRNASSSATNIGIRELIENRTIAENEGDSTFTQASDMVDFLSVDTTRVGSLVQLTATASFFGTEDTTSHETRVLVRRRNVMPPVPSAVFINAPSVFNFSGNSFLVDGNDTNIDGTPGACPPVPGIGVIDAGSEADALGALTNPQRNNIQGQGHFPSVDVLSDPPDLVGIADTLSQNANRTYTGTTSVSGATASSWGTTANPQITVIDGDLTISGNGRGAGVLIVRGDVRMTGAFRWDGVVIVLGTDVTIRGTPDIYGCLMIQADTVDFEIKGNIGVRYSCEALLGNEGIMSLGAATIVSWWE